MFLIVKLFGGVDPEMNEHERTNFLSSVLDKISVNNRGIVDALSGRSISTLDLHSG